MCCQFLLLLPDPDPLLFVEFYSYSPDLLNVKTSQNVIAITLVALCENFSRPGYAEYAKKCLTLFDYQYSRDLRSLILKKCLSTPAMLVATQTPWIVRGGSSNITLDKKCFV